MRLIIQSDISRFITAVTESCAIIGGIQLMKCQVIPVNIQNTPPVALGYIVRINLLVVCQHDCRAAAGNIHATECLNVS